jgi:hypothetical protein
MWMTLLKILRNLASILLGYIVIVVCTIVGFKPLGGIVHLQAPLRIQAAGALVSNPFWAAGRSCRCLCCWEASSSARCRRAGISFHRYGSPAVPGEHRSCVVRLIGQCNSDAGYGFRRGALSSGSSASPIGVPTQS